MQLHFRTQISALSLTLSKIPTIVGVGFIGTRFVKLEQFFLSNYILKLLFFSFSQRSLVGLRWFIPTLVGWQ